MNQTFGRLRLIFFGIFLFGAVAISIYQWFWVRPRVACEARGRWWDNETRACGVPVWVPDLTGRAPPAGVKRPVEAPR